MGKRTEEDMGKYQFILPPKQHEALAHLALERKVTMSELVSSALADLFKKLKKGK